MPVSYKEEHVVKCFEVDAMKNFKAFSFMNIAQEVAHIHSTLMGCGYRDFIEDNNAWILYRAHIRFIAPPKWGDKVTIETWHKRNEGLFSIRDFEMTDNNTGLPLIESTSSWLIMNIANRRVQRTDRILSSEKFAHLSYPEKDIMKESCPEIETPDDCTFLRNREVMPSDIDYNLHMNNARYFEWITDCIDIEMLKIKAIDEIFINYDHECTIGETIALYIKHISETEIYIDGRMDAKTIFKSTIKLKS